MWRFLRPSRRLPRVLSLVCYLLLASGVPLPSFAGQLISVPFPCMHHGCGCHSAAKCWQDCCCMTMEQKLAWARKNGVTPPEYAIEAARAAGIAWEPSEENACESGCCGTHEQSSAENCCGSHGCGSHGCGSHGCGSHGCGSHGCGSHGCGAPRSERQAAQTGKANSPSAGECCAAPAASSSCCASQDVAAMVETSSWCSWNRPGRLSSSTDPAGVTTGAPAEATDACCGGKAAACPLDDAIEAADVPGGIVLLEALKCCGGGDNWLGMSPSIPAPVVEGTPRVELLVGTVSIRAPLLVSGAKLPETPPPKSAGC